MKSQNDMELFLHNFKNFTITSIKSQEASFIQKILSPLLYNTHNGQIFRIFYYHIIYVKVMYGLGKPY